MSATERLLAMLDDGRMSRTDLDPATLAASLRRMVGDGSVEWVTEPMQTRVLLDVADMLDENAKLRELAVLNWEWAHSCCGNNCKMQTDGCGYQIDRECNYEREIYDRMRELGIEVDG